MKTPQIEPTETLDKYINQNGIKPGRRKLDQFKQALTLRGTPKLYAQDGKGHDATAFVKIFDPCGSWTWFLTEWDGENTAFGLVNGFETELGYVNVEELATFTGRSGIGLEIDVHFRPTPLNKCKGA